MEKRIDSKEETVANSCVDVIPLFIQLHSCKVNEWGYEEFEYEGSLDMSYEFPRYRLERFS